MFEIKSFRELGIDPINLHINPHTYTINSSDLYTFVRIPPYFQDTFWNVISISAHQLDVSVITLQIMHIEEEMMHDNSFNALYDAPGYMSLNHEQLQALLSFLSKWSLSPSQKNNSPHVYFTKLHLEDLLRFGFDESIITTFKGDFYYYTPDTKILSENDINILYLSKWSSSSFSDANMSIRIMSYARTSLSRFQNKVFDEDGIGTFDLTIRAMSSFLSLIRNTLM